MIDTYRQPEAIIKDNQASMIQILFFLKRAFTDDEVFLRNFSLHDYMGIIPESKEFDILDSKLNFAIIRFLDAISPLQKNIIELYKELEEEDALANTHNNSPVSSSEEISLQEMEEFPWEGLKESGAILILRRVLGGLS